MPRLIGDGGGVWFPFFSLQVKQGEKKVANVPTPFCNLDMLYISATSSTKRPQLQPFSKNKIINPAAGQLFACVCFCKDGWGGEAENIGKLTERNPSKIPYLLYYGVGISCSEKQLPDMDQSIRYISYFSRSKRKKKGTKTVSFIFIVYI